MSILKRIEEAIEMNPGLGMKKIAELLETTEWQVRKAKEEIKSRAIGPTFAYWDIETTNLRPEMGRIIISSILSYPSMEFTTFRQDEMSEDYTDDRAISLATRDTLERHNFIVGWYSKGFDVPFLNTRLVASGERKLRNHLHIDPHYQHKGWHGIKPTRGSLEAAAEFWGLDERKYSVDKKVWADAGIGKKYALDILVERCESDVRLLAQITEKTFNADIIKCISRYA